MRANSLIMIVLAVVFGIAGVFLSNVWMARQPEAVAATPQAAPQDTIVVAAVGLRFGDRITADNLREIPWTAGAIPTGAFRTSAELLQSKLGDRQVLAPMGVNEPILDWKVTGPGQRATLSATLAEGMKAVSIRVNDVQGVSGFVLPGDRVDVLLSRSTETQSYVDVLLQNIKVLAIDQSADDQKQDPTVAKSVTVEVSTLDAQKLTLAAGVGQLSLALREVAGDANEFIQRVSLADLGGGMPAVAAPAPSKVEVPPARPTGPVRVAVEVIRGSEQQTYDVPAAN